MKNKFIIGFILLAFIFPLKSFAEVEYTTVSVTGIGKNEADATRDALTEALKQISGVVMSSETQLDTIENFASNGNDEAYFNSEEFQQQVNQKTKGVIKEYRIIESGPSTANNSWEVLARVTVVKNKLSKQANRKRIAVLPFRVSDKQFIINNQQADKERAVRLMNQSLTSYLTQTRKFFVADREFVSEILSERKIASGPSASIEEIVKVGSDLSVDLLVVGVIEDLSNKSVTKKFKTLNKTFVSNKGLIEISYRIIDVATKQVKMADLYVSDVGADTSNPDTGMIKNASLSIGNYILSAIYPMRVEAIEDDMLFIGQGGKQVKVGNSYTLFQLGKEIKDSYTGESLGKIEIKIGTVEVVQVTPKISTARLVNIDPDELLGMNIKDLILRPINKDMDEQGSKSMAEIKEEIKEKKKETEENDEENW